MTSDQVKKLTDTQLAQAIQKAKAANDTQAMAVLKDEADLRDYQDYQRNQDQE